LLERVVDFLVATEPEKFGGRYPEPGIRREPPTGRSEWVVGAVKLFVQLTDNVVSADWFVAVIPKLESRIDFLAIES
jgi:hypothetical protein